MCKYRSELIKDLCSYECCFYFASWNFPSHARCGLPSRASAEAAAGPAGAEPGYPQPPSTWPGTRPSVPGPLSSSGPGLISKLDGSNGRSKSCATVSGNNCKKKNKSPLILIIFQGSVLHSLGKMGNYSPFFMGFSCDFF